jgi:hypothetical protein
MGHFVVLIMIPQEIYAQGNDAIRSYIQDTMEPFDESREVKPYVTMKRCEFDLEFQKECKTNPTLTPDEHAQYHGYSFNSDGDVSSTSNPVSLYDWYEVGGRWDGCLTGHSHTSGLASSFSLFRKDSDQTLINNMISVDLLSKQYQKDQDIYGFIVDQDGKLKSRRNPSSWQQIVSDEDWKFQYEAILEANKDNYVVSLDCHS